MFTIDDIIFDRMVEAYAEDFDGNPLYILTQLSEGTIEITGESVDSVDKNGTLIKRFWRSKQGTFTATNAMLNLSAMGAASGSGKILASDSAKIKMPKIVTVKSGEKLAVPNAIEDTIVVSAYSANGSLGKKYSKSVAANTTNFSVTEGVLTPPTDPEVAMYMVKYDREVASGAAIKNSADKFPRTVRLTIKALCVDPCSADTLRACYIVLPSFQVSPEVSISLSAEGTFEYSGDLQVDYCSADKSLYEIYMAEEDEEEEE